jgi:hypothetical protein
VGVLVELLEVAGRHPLGGRRRAKRRLRLGTLFGVDFFVGVRAGLLAVFVEVEILLRLGLRRHKRGGAGRPFGGSSSCHDINPVGYVRPLAAGG